MAFMVPEILGGIALLSVGLTQVGETPIQPDKWYARLQAPGYLDATDWCGPFDTEAEALTDLCETFALCSGCYEDQGECECETDEDEATLLTPDPDTRDED